MADEFIVPEIFPKKKEARVSQNAEKQLTMVQEGSKEILKIAESITKDIQKNTKSNAGNSRNDSSSMLKTDSFFGGSAGLISK